MDRVTKTNTKTNKTIKMEMDSKIYKIQRRKTKL